MSILIKGISMPKDGEFIDLVITADGNVFCYDAEDRKIAEAVELPDHGDLIDRDVLMQNAVEIIPHKVFDFVPVVIPAERDDNGET